MFKKKCPRCNNNVSRSHDFCPRCGSQIKPIKPRRLNSHPDDWGMLGTNDIVETPKQNANPFTGGFFSGGILNKMLGNAMKMLEKEMQKEMKNMNNIENLDNNIQPNTNFQLFINGKKVNLGNAPGKKRIIVKKAPKTKTTPKKSSSKKEIKGIKIPKHKLPSFSKLPKETPETTIRRLSNSIVYEINLPGVKYKKDISITQLENSIEIKAITNNKKKAYHKVLNVSLPIIEYSLEKETLILELAAK